MQHSKISASPSDDFSVFPADVARRSGGSTISESSSERIVPLGAWILPLAVLGALVWFLVIRSLWAWVG